MFKNRAMTITLALLLAITIAIPLTALSAAQTQETLTRKPIAFVGATPNPVGVGQETLLHIGIADELELYWMGWEGLTVTVTKPDGTTETLGPFRTDSTGGTGAVYIPTMQGTYRLQTHFPAQWGNWTVYGGADIWYQESQSATLELVVQAEATSIWPGMPLPSEYWTRPIDAQLHEWHTLGGNWLTTPPNMYATHNSEAPETAHVLWTRQLAMGGLAGGDHGPHSMECGDAYEGKFQNSVIINGVFFYNRFNTQERFLPTQSQEVVAIDIRTGEELWSKQLLDLNGVSRSLAFGQSFYWDSFNYHGVFTYLWTTVGSTWNAYDAFTGEWAYSITGVPSGTNRYGPNGEIYRYTVNQNNGWMTLWNSSRTIQPQNTGGSADGSWGRHIGRETAYSNRIYPAARGIEWNVTIPKGLQGSINQVFFEDRIIGSTTSTRGIEQMIQRNNGPVVLWGLSTAPGREGQLLFNKTWQPPADTTVALTGASPEDGIFVISAKEPRTHYGFNIDTGDRVWGPTESQQYLDIYSILFGERSGMIAYGKLFSQSMSGILYCYDVKSGQLLWTYAADDPYNQVLWANDWSIRVAFITDGKVYMGMSEHSPVDPKPRGAPFACVDIETGEEIWRIDGMFRQTDWGGRAIIGDSVMITMDTYDQHIYAVGKGPSATSISVLNAGVNLGSQVLITGTVTDISPGTKDAALAMRFPNGVAAVSDENMSEWMLYVYKQFPRPDASGVEVTIDVVDANGNYRNVGTTTSDTNGFFSFEWQPDISGKYTVIASFAGSNSYWPSSAQTAFAASEAASATEPNPQISLPPTEMYILAGVAAIIAAIAIVGAIIVLMLKKRP